MLTSHSFFFNDTATTEIYTLSLHDALPISTNNITVCTLTATGGTIDGIAIGSTTRSRGKVTSLDSNSTVIFSALGGSRTGTTSLSLDGCNNARTCCSGSSTATLQSAFNNGASISL